MRLRRINNHNWMNRWKYRGIDRWVNAVNPIDHMHVCIDELILMNRRIDE